MCDRDIDATKINAADLPPYWRERWEERAAIMQYDGGLPYEQANKEALSDILRSLRLHGGGQEESETR